MRILFFTKYTRKGPSSRYRTFQYMQFLKEKGIKVKYSILFGDIYLDKLYSNRKRLPAVIFSYLKRFIHLLRIPFNDIIVIEYELFPYLPGIVERIMNLTGKKYILDYDDAIFHNYDNNSNLLVRALLSSKIPKIMNKSSAVIAANEYLEEFVLQYQKNVFRLPTTVKLSRYESIGKLRNDHNFIVGWIGTPSSSKYIVHYINIFKKLKSQPIIFRFIGFDKRYIDILEGINYEIVQWDEDREIGEIKSFSVGIMPLDNTPFARGKSGFKIIQYMAAGLPVIASDVGENRNIIIHGQTGFIAKSKHEWVEYIKELCLKPQLCKTMGDNGFKRFKEYYSYEVNRKKYYEILTSI